MLENPDDVRDFAERYTAAWCSQDAARVAAFFTPNGSLSVNDGAPAIGRAAIQAVVQSFMTAFPNLCVLLDRLAIEKDHTYYHWTLTGTNTGPGGSGKPVHIHGVERWKFDGDGLVAESRGEFDAVEYQRQLSAGKSTEGY